MNKNITKNKAGILVVAGTKIAEISGIERLELIETANVLKPKFYALSETRGALLYPVCDKLSVDNTLDGVAIEVTNSKEVMETIYEIIDGKIG